MDKIRILYSMETIASGGVEQRRLLLANWFDKEKYEIKIICTNSFGFIPEELKGLGVEVIPVGSFKHPFHLSKHKKVLDVIRKYKPYIFHGATFEGMAMAAIGGYFGSVPIVILEETSDPQNRSAKANFLLRLFVRLSDAIVAISPNVQNYLIHKARIPSKYIRLITNGVQIPSQVLFEEVYDIRIKLNLKKNDFVIGFVGRLFDDHKRVSDLIKAVSLIGNSGVKLLIVGEGKDKEKLEEYVDLLGMRDRTIFTGYQRDPSVFYEIMDVFCIPSSREGFGLVAAEAMLHRLPVLATRLGGLQDIVVNDETGYLIPPYAPEIIAEKIQDLFDHPEVRLSMGEKGYQRAMENYTSERYCMEVEDFYLELFKKKEII